MGTKVRILVALGIGGVSYKPNQVVDMPAALAKAHAAAGDVDANKEAVAYCMKELGAEVIVHQALPTAEEQQLQAEIASLEAKLADASEADKPELQAALDAKKAQLG